VVYLSYFSLANKVFTVIPLFINKSVIVLFIRTTGVSPSVIRLFIKRSLSIIIQLFINRFRLIKFPVISLLISDNFKCHLRTRKCMKMGLK